MNTIGNALSKKSVAAVSVALLAVFYVFAFPRMGASMAAHIPGGGEFDTAFFYTPAQAAFKASLYDGPQRVAMVSLHWTYDLAFPLSYGFFSLAMWALGFRLVAGAAKAPRYGLLLIPLAAPLFDIMENASITALLCANSAGAVFKLAAIGASAFTALKWIFVILDMVGALFFIVAGITAVLKRRRASSS